MNSMKVLAISETVELGYCQRPSRSGYSARGGGVGCLVLNLLRAWLSPFAWNDAALILSLDHPLGIKWRGHGGARELLNFFRGQLQTGHFQTVFQLLHLVCA